jgi:hypothetical protein
MSLCMHATTATCLGCGAKVFIERLDYRIAAQCFHRAYIKHRAHLGTATPDATLTAHSTLSRLNGVTPTSAAICFRWRVPSSGNCGRAALVMGPTPGVVRNNSAFRLQAGVRSTNAVSSRSRAATWRFKQRTVTAMPRRTSSRACAFLLVAAVIISTNCWRRASKDPRVFESGSIHCEGCITSAEWASSAASIDRIGLGETTACARKLPHQAWID